MNPLENPFNPNAGAPPPELVGRDPIFEQARVLLGRIKQKRAEKSMLLSGLRGVGKTVLLNKIEHMAQDANYRTILLEAEESKPLGLQLAPHLKRLLVDLDRIAGAKEQLRRCWRVLRSFFDGLKVTYKDVTLGLDVDPEHGAADSGDLQIDLPNLFVAVAEAARAKNTAVALLIDELQSLREMELGALIMAMHKMQQRQLPLLLLGAGMPTLPVLVGEAKSYAERLFNFIDVGALTEKESAQALNKPVQAAGVRFETGALREIFRLTKGYPYFLQEWGYHSWNLAETSPITSRVVKKATKISIAALDRGFYRIRFGRLTPSEKQYLRAMAELGPGTQRSRDIAQLLNVKTTTLGPVRDKLIKKGMLYSLAHGEMDFTVPLFDEFMRRAMPSMTEDH